jgi:hypothetical protein
MSAPAPELTVVLPGELPEMIAKTLEHLRAQSARDRMEVVVVTPSAARLGLDPAAFDDLNLRIVEVGSIDRLSVALSRGVREARAPIVAMTEGHSYPDPGWAEAHLRAHRGEWAAVGSAMGNANPDSLIGWADLLIAFSRWVEPDGPAEMDALPGHNTSYKRDALLEYGDELEGLLETEILLHWRLAANGHKLYLEPDAKTMHLNVSEPWSWTKLRFIGGRVFAADRAEGWSPLRRLTYVLGGPLIPFVRLWRMGPDLRRVAPRSKLVPQIFPVLFAGLAVEAFGEVVGYAIGVTSETRKPIDVELNRDRHVRGLSRREA